MHTADIERLTQSTSLTFSHIKDKIKYVFLPFCSRYYCCARWYGMTRLATKHKAVFHTVLNFPACYTNFMNRLLIHGWKMLGISIVAVKLFDSYYLLMVVYIVPVFLWYCIRPETVEQRIALFKYYKMMTFYTNLM